MKAFYLITLFAACCSAVDYYYCNSYSDIPLDYYWRDFTGFIPYDAIPGGYDRGGNVTYIGQAGDPEWGILPASIARGSDQAVYISRGVVKSTNQHVKILCTRTLHKFKWVQVNYDDIHLLTDCHLVNGGFVPNLPILYIGRVNQNGETVIGKVFGTASPWKGVWVVNNNQQVNYSSFEILTYDCNLNNYCPRATINLAKLN